MIVAQHTTGDLRYGEARDIGGRSSVAERYDSFTQAVAV